ncbi:exonuclease domain-containing protein [Aestuariimicrobium sp. T2.26MG-19.2B]|uniref:exonuclease domain-containing protein n=1 Tax=Aestuariimicrobium sp. T2.26MG-19.2B TaxID=3040679 RepID=UPI00247791CF|nr:exonuclease domain-containing protein [Aestuariimicrobium sp. T2.26MG-19.2B]CAI9406424.1 3'-5' exonuclease DinG [Aestuariimicrobium sp. T2.26MG-19.2B]
MTPLSARHWPRPFDTPDRLRRRQLTGLGPRGSPALRRYLSTPLPGESTRISDLHLLAIDMETTGLDPDRDRWLSVGFVPIDLGPGGHEIVLGGAGEALVRPELVGEDRGVGDSAVVHGLTDDTVASGLPLPDALDRVLDALAGRVLVAHFTQIEVGQLTRAARVIHGIRLPLVTLDTLELQFAILGGDQARIPSGALRLWAAREQYGLPETPPHDALSDALACAELFLAQLQDEHLPRGRGRLGDLRR